MKYPVTLLLALILIGCDDKTENNYYYNYSNSQDEACVTTPTSTTEVFPQIDLNAAAEASQSSGRELITSGVNIGLANSGLKTATSTTLTSSAFSLPLANNFSTTSVGFDVDLSAGTNIGTVSISLDSAAGVPNTVSTFNDLRILASVINAQIFSPSGGQSTIDVVADAVDLGSGNFGITFSATTEGISSVISLANLSANSSQLGLSAPVPTSTPGIPQVTNGYSAQAIDITTPDDTTVTYNAQAGNSAAETASGLNALQGVTATAQTHALISDYNSPNRNMLVTVNNVALSGDTLSSLETEINSLTNTTLPGISAELNTSGLALSLTSVTGADIEISIASIDDGDSLTVQGQISTNGGLGIGRPQVLETDPTNDGISLPPATNDSFIAAANKIVVGGEITILLADGYDIEQPTILNLIQPLSASEFTDVTINPFDPLVVGSYNLLTEAQIFDSLGLPHDLQLYFSKQGYNPNDPSSQPNHWKVFVLIDDYNVGDPDTTLTPPSNTEATLSQFDIYFYSNGEINESLSDTLLISNWTPLDDEGNYNGAQLPQNVIDGGTAPVSVPPSSSNFTIHTSQLTQTGSSTTVFDIEQNGMTNESTGDCED